MLNHIILLIIAAFLLAIPVSSEENGDQSTNTAAVLNEIQQSNYAIIIGIDDNDSDNIIDPVYSEANALDLYNILVNSCGYKPDHVSLFLDGKNDPKFSQKAGGDAIKKKLQSLSDSTLYPNAGTILLYFSGHGVNLNGRNCLIPCDGTTDPAKSTQLNIDLENDLLAILHASVFKKSIVYIDACKNKFDNKTPCFAKPLTEISPKYKYTTRLSIMISSKVGKYSWDEPDLKHGVFTHYVIEGLQGYAKDKNGLITVGGLDDYVNSRMNKYSEANPAQRQMPMIYGETHPETPIAVVENNTLPPIQQPLARHKSFVSAKAIRTLSGHQDDVQSVAFSHDDQLLASSSKDNSIKLWSVSTGECLRTLNGHTDIVGEVAFSPDAKTLASASSDETIKLWSVDTGKEIITLKGHNSGVDCVAFSPDGSILASGSEDYTIKFWSIARIQEMRTLKGHKHGIGDIDFSPDGQTLASASLDNTIKLWTVETGQEIRTLTGHELVFFVRFSPDGASLASGHSDNTVDIWSVATGDEIMSLVGHENFVRSVAFSPNGRILASASDDNTIIFWSLETGDDLCTLKGHNEIVFSIEFSPDSSILASGSFDKTIKLWAVDYQ